MIKIPSQLCNMEFRFVKLKPKTKIPFEKDWQNTSNYLFDELQNYNGNIGIIGGYGNLRIIDADNKEFAEELKNKIPKTFMVKTGSGGLHFYILSDYENNHVFKKEVGEFRGKNYQVVIPDSIHPNGKKYEVFDNSEIVFIDKDTITEILKPYLRPDIETVVTSETKERDTTRSGREMREVIKLIADGKTKQEVYKEMDVFSKWKTAHDKYKETTYNKSLIYVDTNKDKFVKKPLPLIKVDNHIDNVSKFWEENPFFYDKSNLFWLWNDELKKYEMKDDVDMMILLDDRLGLEGQTVKSKLKNEYIEAFKRVGRTKVPVEAPNKWIQFKDKAFSIESKRFYKITPHYFFTNPIPYEIGGCSDTPTIDKLFEEWVGKDKMITLYQIVAYCCLTEYPIHLIFCLVGSGRNGKTTFDKLLNKFIGKENVCSTELDLLLTSRFETFKLYKKLVCSMGETNFGIISRTSMIKKLCGQDMIGFEYKNKPPFDDHNYAKIIICSNSLPTSEDTSEGFYRRWLIIDFPNTFPEGKDILKTVPEQEYNNLANKVVDILPDLLEKGLFENQGSIEDRRDRYIMASNPLSYFIKKACERSYDTFMRYSELYMAYRKFLHQQKKRKIGYREFNDVLAIEGLEIVRTTKEVNGKYLNGKFIEGVNLTFDWEKEVLNQIC